MDKDQVREKLEKTTPIGVLSYPSLKEPKSYRDGEPKFLATLLLDKGEHDITDLNRAVVFAAKQQWGEKENWPRPFKNPIQDGDKPVLNKKTKKREVIKGHEGMWVVKASCREEYPPQLFDMKMRLIEPAKLYPGCQVRLGIKAHAYDGANAGVTFVLQGVQFCGDGERLGGSNVANRFGILAESDSDVDSLTNDDEELLTNDDESLETEY